MSGKNFMSFGDADTILTEFSNDIKSRVSTKANQGLTAQQQANAKTNIGIENVPNVATNDQTPTFLEESTRTNIASGDKLSLIFGKIKKFFSDLKAVAFSGSYNDLSDKPAIPGRLSDLTDDSSHRTVSDTEKTTWNGKANKKTQLSAFYGTCTTAAATQAKVATITDSDGNFSLRAGVNVFIKFTNSNTFSATADTPITLNVNNTGDKQIRSGAYAIATGTNTTYYGRVNYINHYVYDGTYWVWAGSSGDNNTTYSAMSTSELTTGTATTARSVRADYLKAGIEELIDETMAVPKYDATNRREYYEGGGAFGGNIDSSPTAGSNNAVASGGTKTYVDNAVSQLNAEIDDKAKRLNNIKIIDENFNIRFIGVSDIANRVLCPIVFPFAFASNDYTLECSKIDLASTGIFRTGITVNVKERSSALIILSTTSSAGATYCGVASIHIYRSNT